MPRRGGSPRRCRLGGRQRYPAGGVPALSPAYTAFSFVFLPLSPRPPSRREGGDYRLFYARGCAPCIPGAEPARHWFALPLWKTQWAACPGVAGSAGVSGTRRGACLLCRLPALPLRYPAGACLLCRLLTLPLTCFLAPYPPAPLPGGKGVTIGYFMQGASPLASPGLNPGGTGSPCRCGKLNGRLASALPARRVSAVPGGGRACFVACLPCHCGARGGHARFVAC